MLVKICNQVVRPLPLMSKEAKAERKVVPIDSKSMRYLRFRAIGNMEVSGPNGNYDGFPYSYFEDDRPGFGYKSFIGKRAHLEHNSQEGNAGSIGDLPDAYLNRFNYPEDVKEKKWSNLDGKDNHSKRTAILSTPDQKSGDIEVLMRIDTELVKSAAVNKKTKQLLERIVRMIDTGQQLTCSMGANVEYSRCSSCGNLARFATEYCEHLKPTRKGGIAIVYANDVRDMLDKDFLRPEWLKHIVASKYDVDEILKGSSNKGIAMRNAEINHVVSFFELSVVAVPAYPEAKMLEKLARKHDGDYDAYLKNIRNDIGDDVLLDIYSMMQKDEVISSMCEVR
jgi:hypothetical protein